MSVEGPLAGFSASAGLNVRKSTDGGATWAASGTGIPNIPVNALAVDPTDPTHVWAGTDVGVYLSINSGASWTIWGTGLPNVAVFDIAFQNASPSQRVLRIATHGRGIWERTPLPVPVELQSFEIK